MVGGEPSACRPRRAPGPDSTPPSPLVINESRRRVRQRVREKGGERAWEGGGAKNHWARPPSLPAANKRRRCPSPPPTYTHLAKRPDAQRLAQPVVGQEEVGRGSRAGRRARVGGGAGAGVGLHGGWVGRGGGPTGPRVAGGVKERVGMRNWGGGGGHPKRKKKTGGRGCEVFTPPRFDSRTPPARRRQINPAHTHRRNTLGANTGNHTRKKSSTKST